MPGALGFGFLGLGLACPFGYYATLPLVLTSALTVEVHYDGGGPDLFWRF